MVTIIGLALLLESILRGAGRLVLWRHEARVSSLSGADGALWTFGDSYTFGIGADDPATESWPAVAAAQLRRRTGAPIGLRNFARPGMNSTEIVDTLAKAIEDEDEQPSTIAVLAGINNTRWLGQSGQFCLEEGGSPAASLALVMTGALGRFRTYEVLRHGILAMRPPRAVDRACAAVAAGFQHLDEGKPDKAREDFAEAAKQNPRSGWAQVGIGLSEARGGRHLLALEAFEVADDLGVEPPALDMARAFSLRAVERADDAEAILARRRPRDLDSHALLVQGWLAWDAGDDVRALRLFDHLIDAYRGTGEPSHGGLTPFGLDGRGWVLLRRGNLEGAEEAFRAANAIGAQLHITPHLMGWSHVGLGVLAWLRGEGANALAELEIARSDSAAAPTAHAAMGFVLAQRGDRLGAAEQRETAARLVPELAHAQELRRALDRGTPPVPTEVPLPRPMPTMASQEWLDPADTRLIEADLRRAADLTRRAGARLLVLTYPQPKAHPELSAAHRRAAEVSGAQFLDPRAAFEQRLAGGSSWNELLIPDGHPTTRGYALIGKIVADAIAPQTPPEQETEPPG